MDYEENNLKLTLLERMIEHLDIVITLGDSTDYGDGSFKDSLINT